MSTVQETNRYQRAIRAIAQREQVTTYAIIEWLKKHEGVGCSMREASNELQAWRAMQEEDLDIAADIAAQGLLAATSGLTRDGRARVITRLRQRRAFDWKKLGGSTNAAALRARAHLQLLLASDTNLLLPSNLLLSEKEKSELFSLYYEFSKMLNKAALRELSINLDKDAEYSESDFDFVVPLDKIGLDEEQS